MNKRVSAAIFIVTTVLALYGLMIGRSPLPINIIDRNSSGIVSFGEAMNAHDIGQREGSGGPGCVEYYWYKDGMPAYQKCGNEGG